MSLARDNRNLDMLRGLAVMMVLVFHLLLFFGRPMLGPLDTHWWGLGGVLFFFVHTSLVLMMSLERLERKLGGARLYFAFMLRRVFRIYPLSMLVVAIIYVFHLPMGHLVPGRMEWMEMGKLGVVWNLLLVQNLVRTESILGPLWSLPLEIQMYVFLPFLYLLARRVRTVWPLLGLWVLSVGGGIAHLHFHHGPDLLLYVPCFLPGIIAYKLMLLPHKRWPSYVWPLVLSSMLLMIPVAGPYELGWTVCLLLGLTAPQFAEISNRHVNHVSHWIAKYSYGIYLAHYLCIWLAFVKFGWLPLAAQWAIMIVSVIALPVLLYHALEAPMISMGARVAERYFTPHPSPKIAPVVTQPNG